jgi:hypothetical protein
MEIPTLQPPVEVAPRVVEYRAHAHQLDVLRSTKPLTFLGAGVGAGKTDVGTVWTLRMVKTTPRGVLGMIAANTYPQLWDATLRNVLKNLGRLGVAHKPRELPKSHQPLTLEVWNGQHWVEILCRSMESYENLSGVEIGWAWMDEVWQTLEAAFNVVVARARDRRVPVNQILLTTTLDEPTSWMYRVFVENFDEALMTVRYATTLENEKNLPPGYVERLRKIYTDREFKRMVLARWVTLLTAAIYYAFERDKIVSGAVEFDPALPILWSHDFNIGEGKPMSSCLCQIRRGNGPDGKARTELHVFDEIVLDTADTNDAIAEFKARPWLAQAKAGVRIFGDASGKARDTRSKKTDYALLAEAGFGDQRVPASNPPIRDRHNAVNRLMKSASGDIRLRVHPRCKTVATGLETVTLQGGAQYLEKETRAQHVTTALGYLVHAEFPVIAVSSGVAQMPW